MAETAARDVGTTRRCVGYLLPAGAFRHGSVGPVAVFFDEDDAALAGAGHFEQVVETEAAAADDARAVALDEDVGFIDEGFEVGEFVGLVEVDVEGADAGVECELEGLDC